MCPHHPPLCWVVRPHPHQRIAAVTHPRIVAAGRLQIAVVQHLRQIAIAVVSVESAAGSLAAEACQGVQHPSDRHRLGVDLGSGHHIVVGTERQADVVRARYRVVGSVAAASGLEGARIGAVHHRVEVGSAVDVAVAQEARKEEGGRIDRLMVARSTAVGLVVGLSRVSSEVWNS